MFCFNNKNYSEVVVFSKEIHYVIQTRMLCLTTTLAPSPSNNQGHRKQIRIEAAVPWKEFSQNDTQMTTAETAFQLNLSQKKAWTST